MDTWHGDDSDRRLFWKQQMDAAYDFMLAICEYPVAECGEPLAFIPEAAHEAGVRVLFSPLPHARGLPRLFFLREGLLPDFIAAAREMNNRGWVLKIEDAYRSREMQKYNALRPEIFSAVLGKVMWELCGQVPSVDLIRRRLAALVAMSPRVGTHCCGSAIDVSVFTLERSIEIDRGALYLEMSEKTPMGSPFISDQAARNREEITAIMSRYGFLDYHFEFWHYNKGDAYDEYLACSGRPARYGPVDLNPATGAVTPIADAAAPLNSEEEIWQLIKHAIHQDNSERREDMSTLP